MSHRTIGAFGIGMGLLLIAGPVKADPWDNVIAGLALFETRLNVDKNYLGDGWTVTTTFPDRAFGDGVLDFGLGRLTINSGQIQSQYSITQRGLPVFKFESSTSGGFPLSYTFDTFLGAQNITANGQMTVDNSGYINCLGFYNIQINVSNRGEYTTSGFGTDTNVIGDHGTLDFDLGPINISGNVYLDALAVLTEPFFAATGQENLIRKISSHSAKPLSLVSAEDAIRAKIAAGQPLDEHEIESLIAMTMAGRLLGQQAPALDQILKELEASSDDRVVGPLPDLYATLVPEPTTCLFLLAGLLCLSRRRRHH